MIITSDNTATDQMTTKVGGVEALNTWLARFRLQDEDAEPRLRIPAEAAGAARSVLAGITAEETTGLQYAMSNNPVFELYRPLFTGARASGWTWFEIQPIAGRTRRTSGS